jgi:hypothetical protein
VSVISQVTDRPKGVLYTVAALSLLAGLIHLWVMPEHFEEWWGYGTFFLVGRRGPSGITPNSSAPFSLQSVLRLIGEFAQALFEEGR